MHDLQTITFDSAAIDALFKPFDTTHAPGVCVGIAVKGKPLYRKGFGLANLELPVTLTPQTRMRIGSTTKHFTALAFLLLVEEGRAYLDDPVRKYLPELASVAEPVTMRQLMGHISGLRCSLDLIVHLAGIDTPVSTFEQLRLLARQDETNFPPGQSWSYNNGAYLLLSLAIERITRQSLEEVLQQRIFQPIGMSDTLLRRQDDNFVPNSATQHMPLPDGSYVRGRIGPSVAGEGGIVSTVDDMLRWLAHMRAPQVGSAESWSHLRQPLTLKNGTSTGYGLGLMSNDYRGLEVLHHAGGLVGGSCQMLKVVDLDLDIVVITNGVGANVIELTDHLIDLCVTGLQPKPVDHPGPLIDGYYYCPAQRGLVHFFAHQGQQVVTVEGATLPLRRDAEGVLGATIPHFASTFSQADAASDPDRLTMHLFGEALPLQRVQPEDSALPEASARFLNEASGCRAQFLTYADQVQLHLDSPLGVHPMRYGLTNRGPNLWELTALNSVLPLQGVTLQLDSDGQRFTLTTARTVALSFRKIAA